MAGEIDTQDLLWQNISELPYFRGFLRAIEGKYFRELKIEGLILDLGCGDGHFAARSIPKTKKMGIDPAFHSLISAKALNNYYRLVCSNGNSLPFNESSFRTVISNSVLEHIPDVDPVIKETVRILQPGGKFVITVPNNNFTKNLSIALFLDRIGIRILADGYRRLFNWISRHHHPDPMEVWKDRLIKQGLSIVDSWNYFPPKSLKILEMGHFFGLPAWLNHVVFKKWILFPKKSNIILKQIYLWLYPLYSGDQRSINGAYSLIVAEKQ